MMLWGILLVACSPTTTNQPAQTQVIAPVESQAEDDFYRSPTAVPGTPLAPPLPSPTPTLQPPTETPSPSPTQICANDLTFLGDISIPDGAVVLGGLPVDKSWRVENSGSCNWGEHYRLRLIEGPSLGAITEQALYPARGGTQATIRIVFTAPLEAGLYRSAWGSYTPQGEPFGDIFYIEFVVE